MNRIPGISFVIRARNEEAYLAACLFSLKGLRVNHEIIVILHKCTDRSKAIVEEALAGGQPIRILETNQDLSKAGYETLITPVNHPASLMSFYTWCFSHAKYRWVLKWDADFTASPELVEFFNTGLILDEVTPVHYTIPCQMTADVVNREKYLFNCLQPYEKWMFWEVPSFPSTVEGRSIDAKIYTIPHTVLKSYWKEPPWFIGKDAFLEKQYEKLVQICGPEPVGASRAQCKDCETPYFMIIKCREFFASMGIFTNQ
jgi:glycosyltransferase involved in cell wall biosynthesis